MKFELQIKDDGKGKVQLAMDPPYEDIMRLKDGSKILSMAEMYAIEVLEFIKSRSKEKDRAKQDLIKPAY